MKDEWKKAIQRFLLNNLGQLDQEDLEVWLNDEFELAPLLEPPLRAMSPYKAQIIREFNQISPAEIFDRLQKEHPELVFADKDKAIVKIGKEIEALKAFVVSL